MCTHHRYIRHSHTRNAVYPPLLLSFTPPYSHLLFTPIIHTSYSHLTFTPHTHTSHTPYNTRAPHTSRVCTHAINNQDHTSTQHHEPTTGTQCRIHTYITLATHTQNHPHRYTGNIRHTSNHRTTTTSPTTTRTTLAQHYHHHQQQRTSLTRLELQH